MAEISDEQLIRMTLNGDYDAFEILVKKYEARIYSHLFNLIGNKEDIEDILQEIFLKAYKALPSFKGKSSFFTWLYKISTNICIERLRKHKNIELISIDSDQNRVRGLSSSFEKGGLNPGKQDNPAINLLTKEFQTLLNNVILSLPEKNRVVFILKEIDGLTNEEISNVLGITLPAVKSRLHRSRNILRKRLSNYIEPNEIKHTRSNNEN